MKNVERSSTYSGVNKMLSLNDCSEALAEHGPVYVAGTKRISVRNYSADGLFYLYKNTKY